MAFWEGFVDYMADKQTAYSLGKAYNLAYCVVSVGKSNVKFFPHILTKPPYGRIDIYLHSPLSELVYPKLYADSKLIEQELGSALEWNELPEKNSSVIRLHCPLNISLDDRHKYSDLYEWYYQRLNNLYNSFMPRVSQILEDVE